ncbi:integral membrane protein [Seiridium cupressi]
MDFTHPIDPSDQGLGPLTKGLTWSFTGLAIIVVGARMVLRRKFSRHYSVDDWIMVAALAFQIAYSAIITKACDEGLGMTFDDMTLEQLTGALKWSFIALPFTHIVSVLARISITILLIKIFGQSKPWFKWFLIVYTSLQAIFGIISIILALADQFPIESHYNFMVKPTTQLDPAVQQNVAETLQFLYTVCDLVYVVFPVMFVWKLNMPLSRKVSLMVLLGLSLITFGAALTKAVLVALALTGKFTMTGPDFNGLYFYVSTIEQCLVIMIGCVPTLKPITKLRFPGFTQIGESIASLITRRSRASRKGSSTGGSSYHGDVELGQHERLPDQPESFTPPHTAAQRTHTVQASKSSSSLRNKNEIRRTDNFEISYAQ